MKEFHSNSFLGSALYESNPEVEPDTYIINNKIKGGINTPENNFVICRDRQNRATAVYGARIWDLTPWKHSEDTSRFKLVFDLNKRDQENIENTLPEHLSKHLIGQFKWLTFSLIYFVDTGYSSSFSNSTLRQKYLTLKALAVYVAEENKGVEDNLRFDLFDLLEQEQRFAVFIQNEEITESFAKNLSGIIENLRNIPHKILGVNVVDFSHKRESQDNQTPVIPSRIYMQYLLEMNKFLDVWDSEKKNIEEFIKAFKDPLFGLTIQAQRKKGGGVRKAGCRLNLKEAVSEYELEKVFTGSFGLTGRNNLAGVIGKIQFSLLMGVCFYTGMRIEEAQSLKYEAIKNEKVAVKLDGENVLTDTVVDVISRTTKFTGYKAYASWIAPNAVKRIVSISQHICNGLAYLHELDPSDCHLFLDPSAFSDKRKLKTSSAFQITAKRRRGFWFKLDSLIITNEDFEELKLTDPLRDWNSEEKYQIGQHWPLRTHQCRRSLAFYAANSGMVSATSLRRQFKHLSLMMTRYYANNFENMSNIFGFQEHAEGRFRVGEHIALDLQTNLTIWQARRLIEEVLQNKEGLLGKRGEYIDRRRKKLASGGEIAILELRAETEKRVKSGELRYRQTLLGGCMRKGKCDSFLFGDFTACVFCDEASLDPIKIKGAIEELKDVLLGFEPDSLEYKIENRNLEILQSALDKVRSRGEFNA